MATTDHSEILHQLAEEYTARVRAGELPELEEYARRCPDLAERIRALFPTLLFLEGMAGTGIHEAATAAPGPHLAELTPGQTFNHYRIEREIGRGGMGVVYEAVHVPLGKRVALKVLSLGAAPGSAALERFLREAQTAAGLHHTNIVPVFDIGQAGGLPYYAMQFIEGRGLDRLLQEEKSPTGGEYFRWVADLGAQAAAGLAYAHQRGVIHRDIKPSNLILDEQGVLWITDFGLARRASDPSLTHSGAIVGTPRYMSPEQAEAARKPVDHRTDIYSLGATLYELVTRRAPFTGDTPVDILLQILERDPVAPRRLDPTIPRDLETIIHKAMTKRPEDRYQTAAELAEDLRQWLEGEPIRARRIGLAGRAVRWCRRNPLLASVSTTSVAVIVVLTILYGVNLYNAKEEALWKEQVAVWMRDKSNNHLCRAYYQQAQTVLASSEPGRRWKVLELVDKAEKLRSLERQVDDSELPKQADLRSLAVQGLLLNDLRLQREWPGMLVDPTPHSRRAVLNRPDPKRADGSVVCLDLTTGEEESLARLDGNEVWSTVTLSPDGKVFAAQRTQEPGQVRIWELPERKLRILPPLTDTRTPGSTNELDLRHLFQLTFHPNGSKLAAWRRLDKGRTGLVLWDLKTGEGPRNLVENVVRVNVDHVRPLVQLPMFFSFSPSGRWLTYPSPSGVALWNVDGGKVDTVLTPPEGFEGASCAAFAFAGSDDLLAIGYVKEAKNVIRFMLDFWNPITQTRLARVNVPARGVRRMGFSPDGRHLALYEDVLRILRVADGRDVAVFRIPEGQEWAGWHDDGRRLYFQSAQNLSLWEAAWDNPESGFSHGVHEPRCLALSPDGVWLAGKGGHPSEPIRVIHRETGEAREFPSETNVKHLRFDASGRLLGIVSDESCSVLELATGKVLARVGLVSGAGKYGNGVFDAEGRFLVVGWEIKKEVSKEVLRELLTAKVLRKLDAGAKAVVRDVLTGKVLHEFDAGEEEGSLSPDGKYLVSHPNWVDTAPAPNTIGDVFVWDMQTGERVGRRRDTTLGPLGSQRDCPPQLSPDNRWLLTTMYSFFTRVPAQAVLWSVADGKKWLDIPGSEEVSSYAFSPDSRLLALGYEKGTIQVWDIHKREKLLQWQTAMVEVRHLMFTPDGQGLIFNDPRSKEARFVDLKSLRRQLADVGLDW